MPKVGERGVPHGTFTDHWIRVVTPGAPPPTVARTANSPIEPFFDRDKTGPEAGIYQGMGGIVYATLATNTGALTAAAATLDKALGADTTRGEAHFLLGVADAQLGKTAEAIRALEQAVRIDSGRPDRLRALAQAYERAGRDSTTIDHLYQRALSLQPALAWLRADYADYLQGHGRPDEAIKGYRAALAEQPSLATGWFNLGAVLLESGQSRPSAEARRVFARASSCAAAGRAHEIVGASATVARRFRTVDVSLCAVSRAKRRLGLSTSPKLPAPGSPVIPEALSTALRRATRLQVCCRDETFTGRTCCGPSRCDG